MSAFVRAGVAMCAAAMLAAAVPARSAEAPAPWPDNFISRLEAQALLETLNSDLLSHDSATATLERWCGEHRLAVPARVIAQRLRDVDKKPDAEQRKLLQVSATQTVRYRRVRLLCGAIELSEADNWYVPSRLTAEMNAQLESSETPFGKVIRPLHFQRHTLSATLLWQPLPAGWEMGAGRLPTAADGFLPMPAWVLEHRALLTLPNGTPISEVIETYTGHVLAFTAPRDSAPVVK